MLLGNFFQILFSDIKDDVISARVEINPDHEIFKGHFPGMPIVPGVCQVQMMEEILSKVLGKSMKVKQATQIKFLSFVKPDVHRHVDVKLNLKENNTGILVVEGNYFGEEIIFLKFKGEFDGR